jgi:hypothetical protein
VSGASLQLDMLTSAATIATLFGVVALPPSIHLQATLQQPAQVQPITPIPNGGQQFGTPSTSTTLSTAPVVAELFRLMMSPEMSGVVENDEWDPLAVSNTSKTFLQWTPGNIYVAGVAPVGSDLLLSLDLGNDGWLVGSDNYEARVSLDANNNPTLAVRRLNAANVAGPTWDAMPGWMLASVCKASVNGSTVEYELKLSDAGIGILPQKPQTVGARVDMISSGEPPISTSQARSLTPLNLTTARSEGLPNNMTFEIDRVNQPVVPGESASIRFNFMSKPKTPTSPQPTISKIEIDAEGTTRGKMSDMSSPFPAFDKSGRASLDYVSKVDLNARPGYHVLQAVLTLGDGTPSIVETSFHIAPPIDVVIDKPLIATSPQDRSVGVTFNVASNMTGPATGSVSFTVDPSLHVLNGSNRSSKFTLEPGGKANGRFELFVPANTTGTYPVTFQVQAGPTSGSTSPGASRTIVRYITFGPIKPAPKKGKFLGIF